MVKISGPNRSSKITDHFICISVNVIYCITCTLCKKIYIGEIGRRLTGRFREHQKKTTQMRPNQLRAILIFLITSTTTRQFAGYPYTTVTQRAAKISNKNSSFNWVRSIHTGSMNASHFTNFFTNSCHHISTNFKAPPHPHINQQHPTIVLLALTKG